MRYCYSRGLVFLFICCVLSFLFSEQSELSSNRQDWLQTSVLRNTIEQRTSRLGQYINEAQWRFQLVSWNNAANNHKIKNSRKKISRKLLRIASSDELSWKAEAAQDEDSNDTLTGDAAGKN